MSDHATKPGPAAAVDQHQEVRGRAARGAVWALAGFGGGQALRFIGNLVLTRLVAPEAFGLMVLVNTFLLGLALFSDIGIGVSVIQNKRGDEPEFLNTAWTLSLIRGCAIAVVAALCAWPMAEFYQQPQLLALVPVAAISVISYGASSMRLVTANRHLRLARLTLVELSSQALGLVCMVAWALYHPSVWALVMGGVFAPTFRAILSFALFPPPHERLHWDKSAAGEIVHIGKWVLISTALMFSANNLDRFIFGKLVHLELLGIYNQATQLAAVPAAALSHLGHNIVFPFLSAIVVAGGDLAAEYRRARWPMLVVGGWAVSGLLVGGPAAVSFLYPDIYAPAGTMLQLLAAGSWFGVVLEGPNGAALLARGKANWVAAGSFAKVVTMVPALFVGATLGRSFGGDDIHAFYGALLGLSLAELGRYVVSVGAVWRLGLRGLRQDALLTLVVAGSSALGLLGMEALHGGFSAAAAQLASTSSDLLTQLHPKLLLTESRALAALHGMWAALVITALWSPLLWSAYRGRVRRGG